MPELPSPPLKGGQAPNLPTPGPLAPSGTRSGSLREGRITFGCFWRLTAPKTPKSKLPFRPLGAEGVGGWWGGPPLNPSPAGGQKPQEAGRVLFLGYGNPDRQDDGVAWHILRDLAQALGQPIPEQIGDEFAPLDTPTGQIPHFMFVLQLTPELSETIAAYDVVCFIDAHTGNIEQDLNFVELTGEFQASAFTHHLTPQSCLALAQALYGRTPHGLLLSVRGYEFGFATSLSEATRQLSARAVETLISWLQKISWSGDNLPAPK